MMIGILGISLASCSQTNDLDEGSTDPEDKVITVSLGFGLDLQPVEKGTGSQAKNTISHNYEKQGYKVTVEGNIVGGNRVFKHVDLTTRLEVETTGPIQVTVVHLGFRDDELQEVAYFGTERQEVIPVEGLQSKVMLELVQGYVSITTSSFLEGFVERATIDREIVDMNTVYYSGKRNKDMLIEVNVFGRRLNGKHENVLGEGVVYNVTIQDIIGSGSKKIDQIHADDFILEQSRIQP